MVASFVHYIIAPERVDDHIAAVQKLFRSLKQDKISGVHYSIFLLGENVFIHLIECRREGFIDNFNKRAAGLLEKFICNAERIVGVCYTRGDRMFRYKD